MSGVYLSREFWIVLFVFSQLLSEGEISVAAVAQLVERVLGKDEVMGPNPISSWMTTWHAGSRPASCMV